MRFRRSAGTTPFGSRLGDSLSRVDWQHCSGSASFSAIERHGGEPCVEAGDQALARLESLEFANQLNKHRNSAPNSIQTNRPYELDEFTSNGLRVTRRLAINGGADDAVRRDPNKNVAREHCRVMCDNRVTTEPARKTTDRDEISVDWQKRAAEREREWREKTRGRVIYGRRDTLFSPERRVKRCGCRNSSGETCPSGAKQPLGSGRGFLYAGSLGRAGR